MIEHMFVPPPQVKASNEALKSLEGELAELCGMANAINGRMVELMADALDRNLWAGWGIHSPEHWFGWKTSMAPAPGWEPYFRLVHIENSGAAFGIFQNGGLVFTVVAGGERQVHQLRVTPATGD